MTRRRILFIVAHPPQRGALPREVLDALLVGAVFEQHISVLFIDAGVYQLLDARGYGALSAYEVDDVFADAASLRRLGLDVDRFPVSRPGVDARAYPQVDREPGCGDFRLMPTLHIINASSDSGAMARCLYAASTGDTLLLIGNGVYLADAAVLGKFRSKNPGFAWYVLADDVRARNLADRLASDVGLVDDEGFVDLVVAHHPIVSWSA